jgi:4'-phosphopantetheinyl transferase
MVTMLAPIAVAAGVFCAIQRARDLPVCDFDAQDAEGLPQWRATEYIAARTLLRALLADVTTTRGPVRIAGRATGQPYLPGLPGYGISLSHSDGWVAAAVGIGMDVGVDVQVPGPAGTHVLDRCCTRQDAERLAEMPDAIRDNEFAWLWTAKEACVKAVGTGFGGLPWTVPVAVGQSTGTWQAMTWHALRDSSPVPAACAYTPMPGGPR